MRPDVAAINALEEVLSEFEWYPTKSQTNEFRRKLANGSKLDDILHDAFATVREASHRVFGMRHFDVQLVGGLVLHQGRIAEMRTGEGKTLMATLPVYLNAISGKGVHLWPWTIICATNDLNGWGIVSVVGFERRLHFVQYEGYRSWSGLCCRCNLWNQQWIWFWLLGIIWSTLYPTWHNAHLTLQLWMKLTRFLIDEARTPLIISGARRKCNRYMYLCRWQTYSKPYRTRIWKRRKTKTVNFTEAGVERVESLLIEEGLLTSGGLYDAKIFHWYTTLIRALPWAHKLFSRDTDYIVKDDKVIIIDGLPDAWWMVAAIPKVTKLWKPGKKLKIRMKTKLWHQ